MNSSCRQLSAPSSNGWLAIDEAVCGRWGQPHGYFSVLEAMRHGVCIEEALSEFR